MSESPIDRLFQQARALSGSERDAFLTVLSDESRRAVEKLLAADESPLRRRAYEPILGSKGTNQWRLT